MILLGIDGGMAISVVAIILFTLQLTRSIERSPWLQIPAAPPSSLPSLDVIVPAYNEAHNIVPCVESVVASDDLDPDRLQIWIADDRSTDITGVLAQELADRYPQVHALTVPPRPTDQTWRGKNWACAWGSQQVGAEYLLFLDADVRLQPQAIAAALMEAQQEGTDLLSCAPQIECSCFAEWLVQPIMMSIIAIGYDIPTNNRSTRVEDAFAAGPFMLFRRAAYEIIGGHGAIPGVIVEDLELARQIRRQGLTSRYNLGLDLIGVYMYDSLADLWEGWTKNYFLGTGENILLTLLSAFTIAMVYVMPWIGLGLSLGIGLSEVRIPPPDQFLITGLYGLTALCLGLYWRLRIIGYQLARIPIRYGWLGSLGGILVIAIAIASIVKTRTGWGWTWKGRSLA